MLTAATLGLVGYALYAVVTGLLALFAGSPVTGWVTFGTIAFGLLLVPAAAFVRIRMPGGIPLALGALLGLQALAVHSAAQSPGGLRVAPQVVRGTVAVLLVTLAIFGARAEQRRPPA